MKILITGFDPFGGESVNPAYEAVKLLPDQIGGHEIVKLEIPTVFRKAPKVIEQTMEKVHPDAVVSIGQAGGISSIHVERVAVNLLDARIPDNEGNQPLDEKIVTDGANAYFSKLPVRKMRDCLVASKIPASISYTAGTFVCNDVMYEVLHLTETKYPNVISGFIHVPYAVEQVVGKPEGTPSMSLEMMAKALELAIKEIS